ncbi:hypothetical protein A2U01_0026228 [Trifolium medium]|uniref:Uncharacterized protein n=1 Tax=Trifolium medium TaxID=97028 RepID=A0A392NZH5_9FABA|nr:hypothetical protein [Trifolium medium]
MMELGGVPGGGWQEITLMCSGWPDSRDESFLLTSSMRYGDAMSERWW